MEPQEIKQLILNGIPDAHVEVIDTTGTKDHFSAVVVSNSFDGLNMVKQHQMVYKTLGGYLTNEIHALQLKTMTSEQWEKDKR
ncbi:MAG: BolA family protein [Fidelibacterota bacterium]